MMRKALHSLFCAASLLFSLSLKAQEADVLPGLPGAFTWIADGMVDGKLGPGREMELAPGSVLFLPYPAEAVQSQTLAGRVIEPSADRLILVVRQPGEPRFLPPAGRLGDIPLRTVEIAWEDLPPNHTALDSFECVIALSPGDRKKGLSVLNAYVASGGKAVMGLSGARALFSMLSPNALSIQEFTPVVEDDEGKGVAWEGSCPGGLGGLFLVDTGRFEEPAAAALARKVEKEIGRFLAAAGSRTVVSAREGRIAQPLYDAAEPLLNRSDPGRAVYALLLLTLILVAVTGLTSYSGGRKMTTAAIAVLVISLSVIVLVFYPRPGRILRCVVLRMHAAEDAPGVSQVEVLTGVKVHKGKADVTVTSALPCRPLVYNIEEVLETPYSARFTPGGTRLALLVEQKRPIIFYSCGQWPHAVPPPSDAVRLRAFFAAAEDQPPAMKGFLQELAKRLPEDAEVFLSEDAVLPDGVVDVLIEGRRPAVSADVAVFVFPHVQDSTERREQ